MTVNLKEKLGKELLFFDGAMGTMLQDQGLAPGELPELWNLTRPEVIQSIHASYLAAGCDLVKTNTFGANHLKLRDSGHSVEKVVSAGIRCARQAVNEARHGYVAL
ncbi:MAG: homocysteine methyltransferase, partial [Clostridiales bacterium]|nr:homocysteine methyltransferase [Clostridiales bacterium]